MNPATDRNLVDVLTAILAEIPDSEDGLKKNLQSVRQSVLYAAPEMHTGWWHRVALVLGGRVAELLSSNEPFPEWPEKTRRIFAGESQL